MKELKDCKKILCIRADNMGDVIMSGPAIRAIKKFTGANITLLTSSMGAIITPFMDEIDETISYNFPWIKANSATDAKDCLQLILELQNRMFDAAIIFTVYSQNPLPTALITYMAEIPIRVSFCRENPYQLLTHWIPDEEPYTFIQHQVQRDLAIAEYMGADIEDDALQLYIDPNAEQSAFQKLASIGFDDAKCFVVVHPGVSDKKRKYPVELWADTIQQLHADTQAQVIITGAQHEREEAAQIQKACGSYCFIAAGFLSIIEVAALIKAAPLLISVNTGTVHIACAVKTPVVVLYAQTNPQHIPWKTPSVVLPFHVDKSLQSKNEVIKYVNNKIYRDYVDYPAPSEVAEAVKQLLTQTSMLV
jgi:lipopolysaccharide heptosyltransferase II